MLTNKDIRVENGSLIINGDPYPLDGQSPAAIMQIVKDNSDTTPTENSDAPITSGGVFTALAGKQDDLNFDDGNTYCEIGDTLIQWGQTNIATTAGTTVTASVAFSKAYDNPNYLAILINPMTGDDVRARASSYSTTGFTLNVTDNSSATRYLSWLAVGKKATT